MTWTSLAGAEHATDFPAIFAGLPGAYLVFGPDLTILEATDAYLRATMNRREHLVGRPLFEAVAGGPEGPMGDLSPVRSSIERALETRQRDDIRILRSALSDPANRSGADREGFWTISNLPILNQNGEVSYVIQSLEGPTEFGARERAAEDRFRLAEERFEATFEQHAVGIAHMAPDGRFMQVNARFGELLGYSREEMLAKTIQEITHPDDRAISARQADALITGSVPHYTLDKRYIRKDGTFLWVSVSRSLVRTASGEPAYFVAVAEDISARKSAEASLQEREAHVRSILDTVPDGMILIDQRGKIESFSRTAEKLFGYPADEVLGRNVKMLMPSGDRERHDSYMRDYFDTGVPRIIGRGRVVTGKRKDESTFSLHLSIGEIQTEDRRMFVGFVRDLTEAQSAEARLQELKLELVHMSRFTALGEMASTLAHELNQPLTAVTSYLKGCRRLVDQGLDGREAMLSDALDQAAQQALRAGQIIRRLRDFVTRGESERSAEDLPNLVEEASALALVGAAERGVRTSFDFDPDGRIVYVDRIQIQQVLLNLIRNAIEAMQDAPRRRLKIASACRPDGMVEISVRDTGLGLAPEVAAHLFQPFITTKPTGMGVGLSICRTIVEAHEGKISAARNSDGGTTFRFTVRAINEEVSRAK